MKKFSRFGSGGVWSKIHPSNHRHLLTPAIHYTQIEVHSPIDNDRRFGIILLLCFNSYASRRNGKKKRETTVLSLASSRHLFSFLVFFFYKAPPVRHVTQKEMYLAGPPQQHDLAEHSYR